MFGERIQVLNPQNTFPERFQSETWQWEYNAVGMFKCVWNWESHQGQRVM